jgi:V/A-type H+-transporting ATPase subunit E
LAKDKISGKILEDAEKERARSIEEAENAARGILQEAKDKAKDIESRASDEIDRLRKREEEKVLGLERIELKKRGLKTRQDLIDKAFSKAFEDVTRMPEKEYRSVLKGLFEATVESGDETVVPGESEKALDQGFIDSLNEEKGWRLRLSDERRPIRGGFFLLRGRVEVNASLEFLLGMARRTLTSEVADKLLG